MLLDEVLPRFDAREVHELWVRAPPEVAYAAVKDVTVGEVRLLGPLMALRGLPRRASRRPDFPLARGTSVLGALLSAGFVPLGERAGSELALGAVGRFWRLAENEPRALGGRDEFVAFSEAGWAKAALAFTVAPERGGSRVVTETRVAATSPAARRAFRRYWLLIRLGSGAIRRSWLAAIRRRAERA